MAVLAFGLLVAYAGFQAQAGLGQSAAAYQYNIAQSSTADIKYFDSSFFNQAPAVNNNAYISSLTDTVSAQFSYNFSGKTAADLTYTYSATAQIRANYPLKGNAEDTSNLWTKDYQLLAPVTNTVNSATISEVQKVSIPYAEYQKTANDFRNTLALPSTSEAVITFNMQVKGSASGTPFTDTRVSTVSVPLDQQIYQPSIKFDKSDSKTVVSPGEEQNQSRNGKLEMIGGILAAVAGAALIAYGLRKRIFKSPYQRELDKIYRYHDGIIVRTSRPIDLAEHEVVPMRSFNDMLNLEEELKTPIIADEISSTLTRFMIATHNVLYMFKLGAEDDTSARLASHITRQATQLKAAREVLPPKKPVASPAVHTYGLKPVINTQKPEANTAVARPKSNDIDSIIQDIGKKPTTHKKPQKQ